MQYYAVLDFHLPLKAGSVYGFMYACCIYSRNIEGCYSEFSYIEKVDLGCEKGKHVEIPFLFWIQLRVLKRGITKRGHTHRQLAQRPAPSSSSALITMPDSRKTIQAEKSLCSMSPQDQANI